VDEGNYEGLIEVMEYLQMVKEKQAAADVMFGPLHGIIDMLRHYGVVIPEESLVQLQELPEKWANTKRLSVTAKQQVSPLQSMEVGKLKKRISNFETKQSEFRKSFQGMRFLVFKCRRPYELLAEANKMIDGMEIEMKTLQVRR
jgi:hypothetical protein